jgi:hypothetical protein
MARTVHYESEGGCLRVYSNPSGELFVENTKAGVTMRIAAVPTGLQFTTEGRVEPIRVTNTIGWHIGRR